ncbi:DUF2357 domain-containing protein [Lignipirellula cremea]|uniref:DUF2357 domain-containing protein n=1 Tax=Lignipirellula cremea TaxID=2528010 RepID=A0A518DWP4_9BACT|nr:DUF2357 domain-containing protein [Lignipirellula cremea]QDU96266.1 hypothetical protein Pla8534_40850 [Lignipirellula cremea]
MHEPPEESDLLDGLERFSQLLDELHDAPVLSAARWEGEASGFACRRLGRLLDGWREISRNDAPPTELVVRIAKRLTKIIDEICRSPRKMLQRRRVMMPVHRMREHDLTCSQWLTKQPGRTLAEKTGRKRSILAIQRFESLDTLENRVFLNVLQLSSQHARKYLKHHAERFPHHEYIHRVRSFLRLCQQVLGHHEVRSVGRLSGVPQPNYALLHEPRYQQIWWAYERLIRQQVRRRNLWNFRMAAWSEMCQIALMASLAASNHGISGMSPESQARVAGADVWIAEKTRDGRRLGRWRWSPNWANTQSALLVICSGEEALRAYSNMSRLESGEKVHLVAQSAGQAAPSFTLLSPDLSDAEMNGVTIRENSGSVVLTILQRDQDGGWRERERLSLAANLTTIPCVFDSAIARWLGK